MQDALFFSGSDEFEAWLEQHHATSDGVWIRMAKKHTRVASLDWATAVEVVLCFGWIDGQSRRVDEDWFVQRFTPRRPRSTWSKVNRQKVEKLIADGRMRPRASPRSTGRRLTAAGTRHTTARGRPPCPKTSPRRSTPPG